MNLDSVSKDRLLKTLLPRPRRVTSVSGDLAITDRAKIIVSGEDSAQALFAAQRLAELLREGFGLLLPVVSSNRGEAFQIYITSYGTTSDVPLDADMKGLNEEGYRLEVNGRAARIQSPTGKGLLWGAMTFHQLVTRQQENMLAAGVKITDWPRYPWRGFMIDSGRAPNSLPKMKRVIRICSAFKLNSVIFREGDDELAAVRYRTNKLGSTNPYALSMDEVKDLVEYAYQYGVVVVPEIESLGHSTAKGFYYPDLVNGGFEQKYEGIGTHIRKSHLHVGDPRSYELLASIYDEWFGVIKSQLVHLGLDEVRLSVEEQAKHLRLLLPVVDKVGAKHGLCITPIIWADAPATPPEYRDRVIRCLWSYAEDHVGLDNEWLVKQGMDELSAEGCQEKVFMAGGSGSLHTPYTKSDYPDAFRNLADWARWGKDRQNFIGLCAVQWSGNMLDGWLPDFLAAADYSWNPPDEPPPFEEEIARIRAHLARLADSAKPKLDEVDRPAWDAIWLDGKEWGEDIMTGKKRKT